MDAATVLEQYVLDLGNLPAEVSHILEEVRDKDLKLSEVRKRIQQRDGAIHKFIKQHGSLADNPKEAPSYPKIRADYERALVLQQEKMDLTNAGLYIVAKHVQRLNKEIVKLERDGMLPPMSADELEQRQASLFDGTRSRSSSVFERRSPTPAASGFNTPNAQLVRLGKRQRGPDLLNAGSGAQTRANSTEPIAPVVVAIRATRPQSSPKNGEDEVLYCTCQQVSFGNMVACDNPDCQYEWFHYDCVGLKEPPSGTWFCPSCVKERRENKRRR